MHGTYAHVQHIHADHDKHEHRVHTSVQFQKLHNTQKLAKHMKTLHSKNRLPSNNPLS